MKIDLTKEELATLRFALVMTTNSVMQWTTPNKELEGRLEGLISKLVVEEVNSERV